MALYRVLLTDRIAYANISSQWPVEYFETQRKPAPVDGRYILHLSNGLEHLLQPPRK